MKNNSDGFSLLAVDKYPVGGRWKNGRNVGR